MRAYPGASTRIVLVFTSVAQSRWIGVAPLTWGVGGGVVTVGEGVATAGCPGARVAVAPTGLEVHPAIAIVTPSAIAPARIGRARRIPPPAAARRRAACTISKGRGGSGQVARRGGRGGGVSVGSMAMTPAELQVAVRDLVESAAAARGAELALSDQEVVLERPRNREHGDWASTVA